MRCLRTLWNDDHGATAVEYVLILSLVSLAIVVGAGLLGTALEASFSEAAFDVENAG